MKVGPNQRAYVKAQVSKDAVRFVPSHEKYVSCAPPTCHLISSPAPPTLPTALLRKDIRAKSPGLSRLKTMVGPDGGLIIPFTDLNGNIVAANATDATGLNRRIEFSTTTQTQRINFASPVAFGTTVCVANANSPIENCFDLPPGCDSYGCTASKTTITAAYSESSAPVFSFVLVSDPLNFESELMALHPPQVSGTRSLRYVLRMTGTGEEHIIDSAGKETVTNFTIDRQHGDKMSIDTKFATLGNARLSVESSGAQVTPI